MTNGHPLAWRRGLVLDDLVQDDALRQHLQVRLRHLALILAVAATVFYVVLRLAPRTEDGTPATAPEALVITRVFTPRELRTRTGKTTSSAEYPS